MFSRKKCATEVKGQLNKCLKMDEQQNNGNWTLHKTIES